MKMKVRDDLMKVTIDPLNAYEGIKHTKLWEATGIIPYFVAEAALAETADTKAQDVMDLMNECYGFGLGDYNMLDGGGAIDKDGVYTYPDDEPLSPLVKFDMEYSTVYIYQYALVAVDDGNTQVMQRMD